MVDVLGRMAVIGVEEIFLFEIQKAAKSGQVHVGVPEVFCDERIQLLKQSAGFLSVLDEFLVFGVNPVHEKRGRDSVPGHVANDKNEPVLAVEVELRVITADDVDGEISDGDVGFFGADGVGDQRFVDSPRKFQFLSGLFIFAFDFFQKSEVMDFSSHFNFSDQDAKGSGNGDEDDPVDKTIEMKIKCGGAEYSESGDSIKQKGHEIEQPDQTCFERIPWDEKDDKEKG